jgi:hypothetical protein
MTLRPTVVSSGCASADDSLFGVPAPGGVVAHPATSIVAKTTGATMSRDDHALEWGTNIPVG